MRNLNSFAFRAPLLILAHFCAYVGWFLSVTFIVAGVGRFKHLDGFAAHVVIPVPEHGPEEWFNPGIEWLSLNIFAMCIGIWKPEYDERAIIMCSRHKSWRKPFNIQQQLYTARIFSLVGFACISLGLLVMPRVFGMYVDGKRIKWKGPQWLHTTGFVCMLTAGLCIESLKRSAATKYSKYPKDGGGQSRATFWGMVSLTGLVSVIEWSEFLRGPYRREPGEGKEKYLFEEDLECAVTITEGEPTQNTHRTRFSELRRMKTGSTRLNSRETRDV